MRNFVFIFYILITSSAFAQNHIIDSLGKEIELIDQQINVVNSDLEAKRSEVRVLEKTIEVYKQERKKIQRSIDYQEVLENKPQYITTNYRSGIYAKTTSASEKLKQVNEGDKLQVVLRYNKHWWKVARDGVVGFINNAYIDPKTIPNIYSLEDKPKPLSASNSKPKKASNIVRSFSGNGIKNTAPFYVQDGWKIKWTHTGELIQIYVYSKNGDLVDLPANQLGSGSGSSYIPKGGSYFLKINAMGSWTVKVTK